MNDFAPSWYEQNYPLIAGTSTLLANQQRYLTEPTGYPVNPGNARARALQDSLAAFFTAIPQQQQMAADREKRKRDQELYNLQVQQYQRQAEQAKQMNPMLLEQQRIQNRANQLSLQSQENRLKIAETYPERVKELFPNNKALQEQMLGLPSIIGMDAAINYMQETYTDKLSRGEVLRGDRAKLLNVPDGTVLNQDGTLEPPNESILKFRRRQQRGGTNPDFNVISDADQLLKAGVNPDDVDKYYLVESLDAQGNVKTKLEPRPKVPQKDRYEALFRAAQAGDQDVIGSLDYMAAWMDTFGTAKKQQVTNPVTGEVVERDQYQTPPATIPDPTHKNFVDQFPEGFTRNENIKTIFEGGPTRQARQKTERAINDANRALSKLAQYEQFVTGNNEQMFIDTSILGKEVKVFNKTGKFRATTETMVRFIQDSLKDMLGYGAPQEAELKRLENYLTNVAQFSASNFIKAGGNELEWTKAQVQEIRNSLNEYIQSRQSELKTGKFNWSAYPMQQNNPRQTNRQGTPNPSSTTGNKPKSNRLLFEESIGGGS